MDLGEKAIKLPKELGLDLELELEPKNNTNTLDLDLEIPTTKDDLTEELQEAIKKKLPDIIRHIVEEYCAHHFNAIAREIITAEIRRLSEEKTRQLVDN